MTLGPYRTGSPPTVAPDAQAPSVEVGDCPACRGVLEQTALEGALVQTCRLCHGHLVAHDTMAQLAEGRRRRKGDAAPALHHGPPSVEDRVLECVSCGEPMKTGYFCHGCPVVVDVCVAHGTWFDRLELELALDAIQRGAVYRRPEQRMAPPSVHAPRRRSHPPPVVGPPAAQPSAALILRFAELGELARELEGAAGRHDVRAVRALVTKLDALSNGPGMPPR